MTSNAKDIRRANNIRAKTIIDIQNQIEIYAQDEEEIE